MGIRPYVLLSCAMSVDGYIDDATGAGLALSSPEDFDRVDAVRAACDAIMVGANTLRTDDPSLTVKAAARRAERVSRGQPENPARVTVTATAAGLDPGLRFFRGGSERLVYCPAVSAGVIRTAVGDLATVVGLADLTTLGELLDDLGTRGIGRLMVEGGSAIHTQFLSQDLADELQLAIAPLLVGQPGAARFVGPASYPQNAARRMTVAETRLVGDTVLIRYLASGQGVQQAVGTNRVVGRES